jgi:hypothetical protein
MGEMTILERLRRFIGGCAFIIFLWAIRMTQKEYFAEVYYGELAERFPPPAAHEE